MPFGQGNPIYNQNPVYIPPQNPQWAPPSSQGPREQLRQKPGSSWRLSSIFSWGRPYTPPVVQVNQPVAYGNPPVYYVNPASYPAGNYNGHNVTIHPHAGHNSKIFNIFFAIFVVVPVMTVAKLPPVFIFAAATYMILRISQMSNNHRYGGCPGC